MFIAKRKWIKRSAMVVLILLLQGCSTTSGPSDSSNSGRYQIGTSISTSRGNDKSIVGVLLPTTGAGSKVGRSLNEAAQLAILDAHTSGLEVRFYNTEGTPAGARLAAQRAISEGAQLLVGSLFGANAKACALTAKRAGVKLISFSNDTSVAGDSVYIMGMLPENQIDQLVRYSIKRGIDDFAMLTPNTPYGVAAARYFRLAVQRQGGRLHREATYDRAENDYSDVVKNFLGNARIQTHRQEEHEGEESKKEPLNYPFEAIFIPDRSKKVSMLASMLSHYGADLTKIRLLGTAEWDDGKFSNDFSMLGGWYVAPLKGPRRRFITRFRNFYSYEPSRHASLAYDAVALAAVLARSGSLKNDGILDRRGFSGVDGVFRFGSDGLIEREYAIMQIAAKGSKVLYAP